MQKRGGVSADRSSLPFLKLRTWLVLRAIELWAYVRVAIPADNGEVPKILIFGQGRSGTTLLEDLLCDTGYVAGYGEVLHWHTREVLLPVRYIKGLARFRRDRGIVVHVKGSQLTSVRRRPVDRTSVLRDLVADGWLILHVVRESTFDQVYSEFVAKARGGYHKTDPAAETLRFWVEPDRFLTYCQRVETYRTLDREALSDIPHLLIVYERDLLTPDAQQATMDRILNALNLQRVEVRTSLKKIGGIPPSERLVNYDEIVAMLRPAGYLDSATENAAP